MTKANPIKLLVLVSAVIIWQSAAAQVLTPSAIGEAPVLAAINGRANLALSNSGATAFASSSLNSGYLPGRVNDGTNDNSGNAWIAATTNDGEYVGISFPAAITLAAVAFDGETGYWSRSESTWSLQYTSDASPGGGSSWTQIGSYVWSVGDPMPRTYFEFTAISNVTGIRLVSTKVIGSDQQCVQELEAFAPPPVLLTPSATGDAAVNVSINGRANRALASGGAVAFASSSLNENYLPALVNNGINDNVSANAWIAGSANSGEYVGIAFPGAITLGAVVWDGQNGYWGRSSSTWLLQYTTDASPSNSVNWTQIGSYTYSGACGTTCMPRSYFGFGSISNVTGIRLVSTNVACAGNQQCIQELEAYGPPPTVPLITTQPVGGFVTAGDDFIFTIVAAQADSLQWRKNGVNIGGAVGTSYGLLNVQTNDAGTYTVVLTNMLGAVTSSPAVLTITGPPVYANYTNAVLADVPFRYYPLNETGGTTAVDWGSSGSNGIYIGGCSLGQPGPAPHLGASVHFDGRAGTYVNLGSFHPGNAMTLECWVNLDVDARADYNSIVARWDGSYNLDFQGYNTINWLAVNAAGNLAAPAPANVSRGVWHHLAGVYNTNGIATVFVDGVETASQIAAGVLRNLGPTPDRVLIGAARDGTNSAFTFKGSISQVAFYNRALSPSRIRAHYATATAVTIDLRADTWAATDALGRILPGNADCGSPRTNRLVGIFYFLWHNVASIGGGAGGDPMKWDVTRYLAAHPWTNALNPWADNPYFQTQSPGTAWYWARPALDYYAANDPWVIRRNIALLTHAGVDVLIFDYSNAVAYDTALDALCSTIEQMRLEGFKTPIRIVFLTYNSSPQTITYLYNTLYSQNRYSDLWLYWDGKPVILGYPSQNGVSVSPTIAGFFTWRTSWAWQMGQDQWPWIEHRTRQGWGYDAAPDKPEEVPVTCGGWSSINVGRSFTNRTEPAYNNLNLPPAGTQDKGLLFKEQMTYGLKLDPEMLFITGWNEWIAGVFFAQTNVTSTMLGLTCPNGGFFFVDEYNEEYSRDIEPMTGGHTDNYYYQMVGQIRQFKGTQPIPAASLPTTINLAGDFSDWANVAPVFYDAANDTLPRNSTSSIVGLGALTNNTGRDDFTLLKVARDSNYLYFFAQCNSNITSSTGSNWMVLFIDADQNHVTGWEGYDYAVNLGGVGATTTTLRRNITTTNGWTWTTVRSDIPYAVSGNKLMLRVARADVGLTVEPIHFDFHWADNFQTNDIADFGVSGDSAPDRRFNYRYQVVTNTPVTLAQDDFENGAQALWGGLLTNGSKWKLTSAASYSGSNCLLCSTTNGASNNYLTTSPLNTSSQQSLRLSFRYKLHNVADAQNLNLYYVSTNGAWVKVRELSRDEYYPAGQNWSYDEYQDVWLLFTDARVKGGTNAQFFSTNFAVRIDGTLVNTADKCVWIDDFLLTGVPASTNQPPLLTAISNQTLVAGQWLAITNSATDPDLPAQTLTFSLPSAPSGASLDPASGLLTWRPAVAQSPSSNLFSVCVSDNGTPSLSATQNFWAYVNQPAQPALSLPQLTNSWFSLMISGSSGPDYIVQSTTNLANPTWVGVATNVSAVMPWRFVDPIATNLNQQFYRILLGP